jgi:hypothetical protein
MHIKDYYGNYYSRTKQFNNERHYTNYVAYILTKHGEKVTGEYRVDPEGMYLDWCNNYLSVEKFAEHRGISEDYALEQINKGKSINQSQNV